MKQYMATIILIIITILLVGLFMFSTFKIALQINEFKIQIENLI